MNYELEKDTKKRWQWPSGNSISEQCVCSALFIRHSLSHRSNFNRNKDTFFITFHLHKMYIITLIFLFRPSLFSLFCCFLSPAIPICFRVWCFYFTKADFFRPTSSSCTYMLNGSKSEPWRCLEWDSKAPRQS